MKSVFALAAVAAALLSNSAFANEALAQKKGCLACHQVDQPKLGPAYKDVAKKYKGDKTALATLSAKVIKGGGGVWKMPLPSMPPQAVTEAEAKELVTWILSQK